MAARDLAAGVTLRPGDLTVVDLRRATAPGGRVRDPVGAVLAGPMRHGEVVTDARLVGPALSAGQPGMVTVPVRFPDAGMVALLHVGDRIDVLAAAADGGPPTVLARDCRVLALPVTGAGPGAGPGAENGVAAGGDGRLVVLGVPESAATSVSAASPSHFLTFTFAR